MNVSGSMVRIGGLALLVLLIGACSGNPQPGQSGYPYNVQGDYDLTIEFNGESRTGRASMQTTVGGDVTGSIDIASPEPIKGQFTGNVGSKLWVFTLTYQRGDCEGVGRGSAEVAAGGEMIAGSMEIGDECAPEFLYANITLRR